jgi:hypothetical protein
MTIPTMAQSNHTRWVQAACVRPSPMRSNAKRTGQSPEARFRALAVMCAIVLLSGVPTAFASASGLVGLLTQQLGVTETQAKGGAGALFDFAKSKLSKADFAKVAAAVPGMDDLLRAAPKSGGTGSMGSGVSGMLGGASSKSREIGGALGSASSVGSNAEKLGSLSGLVSSFSKLGLSADMVQQFIPPVLSFVENNGGKIARDLLASVLQ